MTFNGQEIQEQTLDQYVHLLPPRHCVRLQLDELRDEIRVARETIKCLESDKDKLLKQIRDLNFSIKETFLPVPKPESETKLTPHAKPKKAGRAVGGHKGDSGHTL